MNKLNPAAYVKTLDVEGIYYC